MSQNALCDRCGGDTGRPCPSHGMKDAAIPDTVQIDTAHQGKKTIMRTKHLHLCTLCIASLKEWFDSGKKEKSSAPSHQ
jgi:hypothetical protein